MSESWEYVKEFYKEHFGIDKWVVEMFANMDILMLCASGASNTTISTFLNIPIEEINLVINEIFEFDGWQTDLPINPYKLYKNANNSLDEYVFIELLPYTEFNIEPFDLLYICETMNEIEERIENEWI